MKILIDARLYGLENAGLGRYLNNLVDNLISVDQNNEYVILLRKKYFKSLNLPTNWKKVLTDFRHYGFCEQILLPFIIKKEKPDLVHFPHFNVPVFYSGPFVVTIHDLLMHNQKGIEATTLSPLLYFIKRLAYNHVFKCAVNKSSKIITPSRWVKDQIVKTYKINPDKVIVSYEGLDKNIEARGKALVNGKYFVYSGNAYPHKNLERLVKATLLLNNHVNQKIFLAIASARNVFTQRLEKLIKKLDAAEYVKLLGFVPDEDLGLLYKNSIAFVSASISEGFGLPGLEAMNAGTLLLASNIEVYKEIYNGQAIYFNPLDFSAIEKAMENAINLSPEERKLRIEEAGNFVKKYSWEKMAKETLKVYQNNISEW
jgi:glycosyltransferase involved in cell wall biosynthesis